MKSFLETLRRDRETSIQRLHIKCSSTDTLALENINRELGLWTVKEESVAEVIEVYQLHDLHYAVQYALNNNLVQ